MLKVPAAWAVVQGPLLVVGDAVVVGASGLAA